MNKRIRRSLFIGLGGIGVETIRRTKAAFYEEYSETAETIPCIGFLGIDTDVFSLRGTVPGKEGDGKLSPDEQLFLRSWDNLAAIYQSQKEHFAWFPKENVPSLLSLSPDAVRSKKRLLLSLNKEMVVAKLRDAVCRVAYSETDAVTILDAPFFEIHLVFSLAGGTGSGIFLDVAEIIQDILEETNIKANLIAYVFLPDAFSPMSSTCAGFMLKNSYAALLELDYRISQSDRINSPFYKVFFVGQTSIQESIQTVCSKTSQMLFSALGELGVLISDIDDTLVQIRIDGVFDVLNKKSWAYSFGVSDLMYDHEMAINCCSLKIQIGYIDKMLQDDDCYSSVELWLMKAGIREEYKEVSDWLFASCTLRPPCLERSMLSRRCRKEEVNGKLLTYFRSNEVSEDLGAQQVEKMLECVGVLLKNALRGMEERGEIGKSESFLRTVRDHVTGCTLPALSEALLNSDSRLHAYERDLSESVEMLENTMNRLFPGRMEKLFDEINDKAFSYIREKVKVQCENNALVFFDRLLRILDLELEKMAQVHSILLEIRADNLSRIHRDLFNVRSAFNITQQQIELLGEKMNDISLSACRFSSMVPLYDQPNLNDFRERLECLSHGDPIYTWFLDKDLTTVIDEMTTDELESCIDWINRHAQVTVALDSSALQKCELVDKQDFLCLPSDRELLERKGVSISKLGPNPFCVAEAFLDRITVLHTLGPLPVFAISSLQEMRRAYENDPSPIRYHTDALLFHKMKQENFSLWPNPNL